MKPPRSGVRVTRDMVQFGTRELIQETILRHEAFGQGFRTPLFRAAANGQLDVATVVTGGRVPERHLRQKRPLVIILQDDHPAAIGPNAWPQARKLARWARTVALHATAGQPEHYAWFATNAVRHGRLLVIEVELRHLAAWHDLILLERRPAEVLVLKPPPGGQHPVSPAQAGEVVH